jgi:patatin-like phospholipase/acyl hydrolase
MPAYNILSLDGGGIRGIFSARMLERLEQAASACSRLEPGSTRPISAGPTTTGGMPSGPSQSSR